MKRKQRRKHENGNGCKPCGCTHTHLQFIKEQKNIKRKDSFKNHVNKHGF